MLYPDRGGIRGLSTLYILKGIIAALGQKAGLDFDSPLCLCDYFDLIVGISIGGSV